MSADALTSLGWQHLFGYAFSLLVGQAVITRLLHAAAPVGRDPSAALLGMVERFLYTSAVIVNQWNFIAVWLGMKAAREVVERWGRDDNNTRMDPIQRQRTFFNRWLSGTGLSLLYGVAGGQMIQMAGWGPRLVLTVVLIVAPALALWWLLRLPRPQ